MPDSANLEDQPIAWTPTPEVIEHAQLTKFMRQVGVSSWDELYAFSIRDVEKFTEEVLKFLDIRFDPPYEKLLDTSNGIEFPNWFERNADTLVRNERNADTLVRNEGEARTTAETFANKRGWDERGYLPHFDGVVAQFVTFRLADSLPQNVLRKLKAEIENEKLSVDSDEYRQRVEDYLDKGIGSCILSETAVAEIVEATLLYEHNKSCRLISWVIMPNHVHILMYPLQGHSLSEIMKRVKGISARKINQALGTSGPVWQPDYFDRYVRDEDHFAKTVSYIANNPVKAGLSSSPEVWRFSSFSPQAAIADKSVRVPTAGLNITEMCLDRWQTDEMKNQPAVIWEGEEQDFPYDTVSYEKLRYEVDCVANGLREDGFGDGDAIGIHLPMIIETVVVLLAINRIGAIAVPVFSGYGVDAIASRMNAVGAKGLISCDKFPRRGKEFNSLAIANEAVKSCPTVRIAYAVRRHAIDEFDDSIDLDDRFRDFYQLSGTAPIPVEVAKTSAEDPLIILYTSGTTGKPKGIAHTHASFPIKAAQDMAFGTDVGRGTRICWYTDIGWMMGPWLIYGALINGATICIYDGAPDYPTPDRMWEFCAKHKVEVLGISPTLVRALAAAEERDTNSRNADAPRNADALVRPGEADASVRPNAFDDPQADEGVRVPPHRRHDLSSLRIFASTGEPWNPDPWRWLFEKVGNSRLPIINYSGGTEIAGGILMGNPLLPIKPCSFPAPCPGMDVDILDEDGNSVPPGQVGELVIKRPWIGMARGFWQEKERYLDTYWRRFKNIWVHGDWAMRDKDGHWFILGRSDDTLKVAGKRVGPAEVESILVSHPAVTEAAVIGVPDEAKGTAMVAFVVCRNADAQRTADALVRPGAADASVRTTADTFANKRGWHTRGYIPHFDGVVTQFVTFRLADSLPQNVLRQIKQLSENDPADPAKEYRKRVEEYLDRGIGECLLRDPVAARIVEETLLREDGKSIRLIAWVIMPNHAHVMLRPLEGHSLSDVVQTVKSVSSHRINKALGRSGAVWQPDYFDRFIRDEEHFVKAIRYIHNNPVKAGLCGSAEAWEFSSAVSQAHADEGVRDPSADEGVRVPEGGVRVPFEDELKALVAHDMGKPLAPSRIHFVSALPKTRNAKVMRRVIRAAYMGEDAGDLSALENPAMVEEIEQAGLSQRSK